MKIHEVIRLKNAYGGEMTLDDLVKRMQGNKIHRCPKCGGSGTTIKRVNRAQYSFGEYLSRVSEQNG